MSDFEEQADENVPVSGQAPETAETAEAEDPIEDALYTSFMQAHATGADASQAFNVGVHAAKQVALDAGIPEPVFEKIASDLFGPYTQALNEGSSPQEALRAALQSLDG